MPHTAVEGIAATIEIQPGALVSKVIYRHEARNVTLFGFDGGTNDPAALRRSRLRGALDRRRYRAATWTRDSSAPAAAASDRAKLASSADSSEPSIAQTTFLGKSSPVGRATSTEQGASRRRLDVTRPIRGRLEIRPADGPAQRRSTPLLSASCMSLVAGSSATIRVSALAPLSFARSAASPSAA
jgi:hypothetical protein